MIKIFVKNVSPELTLPTKGSEVSAGYDIIATSDPKVVGEKVNTDSTGQFWNSIDYVEYETNIYITPEFNDIHTLIHPRSSVSKYNLSLANAIGLIDNDYTGMLICRFNYVWQPNDLLYIPTPDGNTTGISARIVGLPKFDKMYKKGDKIAQLVFEKTLNVEFVTVNELPKTNRGSGGFGSTDKAVSKPLGITAPNTPELSTLTDKYKQSGQPKVRSGLEDEEVQNKASGNLMKKYKESGGIEIKSSYSEELKRRTLNG